MAHLLLQAYRRVSIEFGEHFRFNRFLCEDIKAAYNVAGRHKVMWDLVVKENVTLISTNDDSGSSVNPEVADAFLSAHTGQIQAKVEIEQKADDDDLFDDMA